MASEKINALIEEVKALTVLELSELVHALEEEFGVSAAAMAAPAAGAAAAPVEEKTEFDVVLAGFDAAAKIKVIKAVREITGLGLARTFQNIRLFKQLSVLDNVKVGLHNKHHYSTLSGVLRLPGYRKVEKEMDEQAMELLKVFNLEDVAHVAASNLPYGQQRRLEIARAMATEPKLLLLDEPAAGMNPNETGELMDMIRFVREKFHMTILLIEHDMKLVSGICEKLTVLNFGEVLCEGKTSDVLNDPQVVTAYLGE